MKRIISIPMFLCSEFKNAYEYKFCTLFNGLAMESQSHLTFKVLAEL